MTDIILYRCKDCHKVFTNIGACHGHVQGHMGLLKNLKNLITPDVEYLNRKTEKLIVKNYVVSEKV